jgi:hypothetical protein
LILITVAVWKGSMIESRFGSNVVKRSKKKHCIEEYKAKTDFIKCVCGFTGTEHEFDIHMGRDLTRQKPMDYLTELATYRGEYPTNGTLFKS